jgi:antitoxin component YwqK of YwqJK toxin-antitoxin module
MKLKTLLLSLFLLLSTSVLADSNENCLTSSDVEQRDGLYYLAGQDTPFTGTSKCIFAGGQIQSLVEIRGGNKHGKYTWWYENGSKQSVSNYKNGKLNGTWTKWYENGHKQSVSYHKDGKLNGKWTKWYSSGKKRSVSNHKEGKLNGKRTAWHANGKKQSVTNYEDGRAVPLRSEAIFELVIQLVSYNERYIWLWCVAFASLLGYAKRRYTDDFKVVWAAGILNALVVFFAISNEMPAIAVSILMVSTLVCLIGYLFRFSYSYFGILFFLVAGVGLVCALFVCVLYGLSATGGGTQSCF